MCEPRVTVAQKEYRLAVQGQRRSGRTAQRGRNRSKDNDGIIPVLAKAVRAVENGVQRGRV